jgi:hypothetical protein
MAPIVASVLLALASGAAGVTDPVLTGDPLDPDTGRVAEIVPGAPWIRPGPDGLLGTADDLVFPGTVGDVDLVVRTGLAAVPSAIPDPSPLTGSVPTGAIAPFGAGMPVPFVVVPSDGLDPQPYGSPAVPAYLEGMPVFVVAFADLDGDGYVGITHLDGDSSDASLERAELVPVGRRYVLGSGGGAAGTLAVTAGGPPGAPLRIAVAAAAYAGDFDPAYRGGIVPNGPAVMTHLPFLPVTDPAAALMPTRLPLRLAESGGRVAMRALPAFEPDPADPRIGEAFTLRLDGSDPSIDVADTVSGAPIRFGVVQRPDPALYLALPTRPLRPGLDTAGQVVPFEVLNRIVVADDGGGTPTRVRIVALDQLGNVTAPGAATQVVLRSRGVVRIASPDADGDPFREIVVVADARGVEVALDDWGGAFDDHSRDRLSVKAHGRPARYDVVLPDPDVDDDGTVGLLDQQRILAHLGAQLGEGSFDPGLDLDGNGRIEASDAELVGGFFGLGIPPDTRRRGNGKHKGGHCGGKVVEAVFRYTGEGCGASLHSQKQSGACSGGAGFAEPVRIVAEELKRGQKRWADRSGIPVGGTLVVSGALAGRKDLSGRSTHVSIQDDDAGAVVETFELRTDCKEPLFVGDQFGSLQLVELTSKKGGTVLLPEQGIECTDKPMQLELRYLGGDCTRSTNLQEGKHRCDGADPGPGPVSVRLTKDEGKISAAPAAEVMLGDVVRIRKNDGKDLASDTQLEVAGVGGSQALTIHTSCSKPLRVGDRFGSFLVLGLE